METQKQVVHFEAKKGFTTAQSNEHQRRWTEKGWASANENGRIDRTRTELNFEVVKGGKVQAVDKSRSIPEKFHENIRSRGIPDPNASCPDSPRIRTVVDFIISGTHERLCQLAFGKQKIDYEKGANNSSIKRHPEIERWAKDMYNVLAGRFGEENILSFVVHLDERSPHIHADIIPVTDDNRISFKDVFCGKDKYEYRSRTLALHDLFAAVNRRWGLQRGDSVHETHRKHQSTEDYRRELSGQCNELEREVEHKSATLHKLDSQIGQALKRMKSLTTMVSNLEAAKAQIEKEIGAIRQTLSDDDLGTDRRESLRQQEESLQEKLGKIMSSLADKRGKLKEAERKLADLKRQVSQSEDRQEELQRQIKEATSQVSELTLNKVGTQALWTVLRDFQEMKRYLPSEILSSFDDSLLQDMSRQGVNILTCAALLFVGMVDQATTFAENKGGGGGHSLGNWGRDPEEDERAWIMRCLARSRQMMKPSGQKLKR